MDNVWAWCLSNIIFVQNDLSKVDQILRLMFCLMHLLRLTVRVLSLGSAHRFCKKFMWTSQNIHTCEFRALYVYVHAKDKKKIIIIINKKKTWSRGILLWGMHIYIVGDENEFSKARCRHRKKQNDDDNYIRLPLSAACWSAGA